MSIIILGESLVSEEYLRYSICKEMGWDYYTYESQPPFFIEEMLIFKRQEAEKENMEGKKVSSSVSKASKRGIPR